MTVFIDNMHAVPMGKFRRMKMSHMIATTFDELHAMADKIGVARKWFQRDHYDICLSKRAIAVQHGAVEVTMRQLAALSYLQRIGEEMGEPETAVERMLARKQGAA